MKKTYDIKWQNDLVNQIPAYTAFAFEGNVNDLQPVLVGEKYEYLPMMQSIDEIPLTIILQQADMCASFMMEEKIDQKVVNLIIDYYFLNN